LLKHGNEKREKGREKREKYSSPLFSLLSSLFFFSLRSD
jgi:hypothetical protein